MGHQLKPLAWMPPARSKTRSRLTNRSKWSRSTWIITRPRVGKLSGMSWMRKWRSLGANPLTHQSLWVRCQAKLKIQDDQTAVAYYQRNSQVTLWRGKQQLYFVKIFRVAIKWQKFRIDYLKKTETETMTMKMKMRIKTPLAVYRVTQN